MLHDLRPPIQSTRVLDRSGVSSLIAALVLLLIVAGASVWQASENSDALALAQGTRSQRNNVANILLAAQDAETGQRGYLLTSDPDYLQPFTHTQEVMPQLLASLAAARPGDKQVGQLAGIVTNKLAELDKTVVLATGGDVPAAIALVRTNVGRNAMLEIRQIVGRLEAALDADLVTQVGAVTRGGRRLIAIDIAGLVMVLALTGLIALGLRTYLTNLRAAQVLTEKANESLERTNEQLDELVRVRTEDLTAANEEIQRFAYIVSHDLRAPLVNVMGFTSELEQAANALTRYLDTQTVPTELREAIVDDIPEALRFIRSSTTKMDRLINAILKLSREGRRVLTPERLDMAAMLHNISDSLQHQASMKQAVIEIGEMPSLIADRLAVEQIFTNVTDNALKYLKLDRPGSIKIVGAREGPVVRYDIADNGRGIAERDYERVFELFRRAGDQTVPGEGIGLAHVRALVRRLGGSIECMSTLGVGTTFTIRVPAVAHIGMENAA